MRGPEPEHEPGDGRVQEFARDLHSRTGISVGEERAKEKRVKSRVGAPRGCGRTSRSVWQAPRELGRGRRTHPDLQRPRSTRAPSGDEDDAELPRAESSLTWGWAALSSPVACPFCARARDRSSILAACAKSRDGDEATARASRRRPSLAFCPLAPAAPAGILRVCARSA